MTLGRLYVFALTGHFISALAIHPWILLSQLEIYVKRRACRACRQALFCYGEVPQVSCTSILLSIYNIHSILGSENLATHTGPLGDGQ